MLSILSIIQINYCLGVKESVEIFEFKIAVLSINSHESNIIWWVVCCLEKDTKIHMASN